MLLRISIGANSRLKVLLESLPDFRLLANKIGEQNLPSQILPKRPVGAEPVGGIRRDRDIGEISPVRTPISRLQLVVVVSVVVVFDAPSVGDFADG